MSVCHIFENLNLSSHWLADFINKSTKLITLPNQTCSGGRGEGGPSEVRKRIAPKHCAAARIKERSNWNYSNLKCLNIEVVVIVVVVVMLISIRYGKNGKI